MYYIYSMPGCSACNNAALFLEERGIDYMKVDLMGVDPAEQAKLQKVAGVPFRTVPQIFVEKDDHMIYVGGFDNLRQQFASADEQ